MDFKKPVGLITNINAKRIRKTIVQADDLFKILGGNDYCINKQTRTIQDLNKTIAEFKKNNIQIILSNGGDGTHQKLINTLIEDFKDYSPFIIPLKSGTMNMLAKNLDLNMSAYKTAKWVRRLLDKKEKPIISVKPILEINSTSLPKPKYGFVFIAGCGYKLLKHYYSYPEGGKRSAAKAIISSMAAWAAGSKGAKNIYTYTKSSTVIDDKNYDFPYLITLASSIPSLVLGFSPFALKYANHDGFFFMIDGEPMYKNYNIFKFFKIGDEEQWLKKRLVSRCKKLKISVEGGFSIDGEVIELDSQQSEVTIKHGPKINFITPIED